ncbi:MAG: hypothetical protein WAM85_22465 [Terracidiphilus sp.]
MDATSTETAAPDEAISPAGTTNPWVRIFNRVFSRHLMNIALLLMLPMLIAPTLNLARTLLVDPDIWWHLADARFLFTTHHFIQTDTYSFTVYGQRWINPEWLSEMPFWFGYQSSGLRGIYLVTWLALGANILFVYWRGYLTSRHAGAALWAAGIGFLMMTVNSGPRTIAIAYIAMSALLAILEAAERGNSRLLWLLPPLFCVWINLHGSWLIGIALLCLYILCGSFRLRQGAFDQEAFTSPERVRLLTVLGASVAALMVNPYGWRLLWNPFDMMLNQKVNIATVAEWQPLRLSSLEGEGVVVAIGLMVIANCMRGRKWKVFELAVILFAWYAAIDHHRFTYLAAVLTTPLLARDIQRSFCTESSEKTIPAMNALMVAGAVCVMVWMFPSESTLGNMLAKMFPEQTIAAIQPSWRTMNWDYLGGRMAFEFKPTFIDSRFDTFEHHGVMQDYGGIFDLGDSFQLMDKYRIDHVLVQENVPLSYLLAHSPGWRVESREKSWDGYYVLFAKTPGASAPSALFHLAPADGRR